MSTEEGYVTIYLGKDGFNKLLSRHKTKEEALEICRKFNALNENNSAWYQVETELENILAAPRRWRFDVSVELMASGVTGFASNADNDVVGRDPLGVDPEEVIDVGTIQVRFDYPLRKPVVFEFTKDKWDVEGLMYAVCEKYQEIYDEEDASTSIPVGQAGFLLNRNKTNGKYGIWGHGIGDLALTGFSKGADGVWELDVES